MRRKKLFKSILGCILSFVLLFSLQGITSFGEIDIKAAENTVSIEPSVSNGDYGDYVVTDDTITLKSSDIAYEFKAGTYSGRYIIVDGKNIEIELNDTKIINDDCPEKTGVIYVPPSKNVAIKVNGSENQIIADGTSRWTVYSLGDFTVCGTGEIEFNGAQHYGDYQNPTKTTYEGNVTIHAIGKEAELQSAINSSYDFEIKDHVTLIAESSYGSNDYLSAYSEAIGLTGFSKSTYAIFTIGGFAKVSVISGKKDDDTYPDGNGIGGNGLSRTVVKDQATLNSYVENATNIMNGQIVFQDNATANLISAKGATGGTAKAVNIMYCDTCVVTGNAKVYIDTANVGIADWKYGLSNTPLEISGNGYVKIHATGASAGCLLLESSGLKMKDQGYIDASSEGAVFIIKLLEMSGESKIDAKSTGNTLEVLVENDLSMADKAQLAIEGGQRRLCVDGDVNVTGGDIDVKLLEVKGTVSITGGNSHIQDPIVSTDGNPVILPIQTTGEYKEQIIIPSSAKVGDVVNIQAKPGYFIDSISVNGTLLSGTSFVMPDKLTTVEVKVTKDESATTTPTKVSISKAQISKINATTYTGYKKKPTVTVKFNGKKLKKGVDYTVSYQNNTKVGTAKVVIKGIGKYSGTKTVSFKIKKRKKYAKGIYVVKSKTLKGRKGPSNKKGVKARYKRGDKLEVVKVLPKKKKSNKYMWLKVKKNKKTSYVYAKYLKL